MIMVAAATMKTLEAMLRAYTKAETLTQNEAEKAMSIALPNELGRGGDSFELKVRSKQHQSPLRRPLPQLQVRHKRKMSA